MSGAPRVIAVANQKGGVGKTTTAVSLGGMLAGPRRRVLLIDLDPHASMTGWLLGEEVPEAASSMALFEAAPAPLSKLARSTRWRNLDLVPAHVGLASLERQLAGRPGAGRALLRALAGHRDHDLVLVDCPPVLGTLVVAALAAASLLLVPTQCEPLALPGLSGMLRTRDMVSRSIGRSLPALIVGTMYDQRTRASVAAWTALQRDFGRELHPVPIPVDTRLRDASRVGEPISAHAPESRAAQAYATLVPAVLRMTRPIAEQAA